LRFKIFVKSSVLVEYLIPWVHLFVCVKRIGIKVRDSLWTLRSITVLQNSTLFPDSALRRTTEHGLRKKKEFVLNKFPA
jgi:hypothetical protein